MKSEKKIISQGNVYPKPLSSQNINLEPEANNCMNRSSDTQQALFRICDTEHPDQLLVFKHSLGIAH